MNREAAIDKLAKPAVAALTAEQRRNIVEEWWPNAPEMTELPLSLREEAARDEAPAEPLSPRCEPLLFAAIRKKLSPGTNAYLEELLRAQGFVETVEGIEPELFGCRCCGYCSLDRRDESYICTVCYWEDDGITDPSRISSPNHMTLAEGRENYARIGACHPQYVKYLDPARLRKYRFASPEIRARIPRQK